MSPGRDKNWKKSCVSDHVVEKTIRRVLKTTCRAWEEILIVTENQIYFFKKGGILDFVGKNT